MRHELNTKRRLSECIRALFPMLFFFVLYMVAFEFVEHRIPEHGFNIIHAGLDDKIPFVEAFIVPYLLWFPYVACNIILLALTDRKAYTKMSWVLMIGMTLFIVVSVVYPNELRLRPAGFDHDDIFTRLILNLYRTDTPTNVAPSIHIYNSLAIAAGVLEWSSHRKSLRAGIYAAASCIIALAIVLSTMFIKQHSVIDVLAAAVLFAVTYYVCSAFCLRRDAVSGRRVNA